MNCGGHTYDLHCLDCCVRLIVSCRSAAAPKVARQQQNAMLALIERVAGNEQREATIEQLKRAA